MSGKFNFTRRRINQKRIAGRDIFRRKKKDIGLYGTVISVIRDLEANKKAIADVEITVVCADCGKTDKGTRKFLKGAGWKLRGEPRCLNCDLY